MHTKITAQFKEKFDSLDSLYNFTTSYIINNFYIDPPPPELHQNMTLIIFCLNLQMFRLMDMDNNKVLSWAEIMTFNITSLLVNYGDMLPFDPADVHNEDAFLESDVLDELTNGLTDGPTEETKSSPQNKVSEEAATPHDEF